MDVQNGKLGHLVEGEGVESKPAKPPRTHWDMLRAVSYTHLTLPTIYSV